MRVLVTGADGFVGRYLVERLEAEGRTVVRPAGFELTDDASIRAAAALPADAVVHLAAVASNRDARRDPGRAWIVNAAGTARLLEALGEQRTAGDADPVVLIVSTGEVYGAGTPDTAGVPRGESDPLLPQTPYAASKAGAELAALEVWRRTGLRVIVARPFTHSGPGQSADFVLPAFAARLEEARAAGRREIAVGNLDPVRDLLHVRDVVDAYLALLRHGVPGEVYNIARGEGVTLREVLSRLASLVGVEIEPRPDPALVRRMDVPYLVGDARKLRRATGWTPTITLDAMLRELVDA